MTSQGDNIMKNVGQTDMENLMKNDKNEPQRKNDKVKIISKQEFRSLKSATVYKPETENVLDVNCQSFSEIEPRETRQVHQIEKSTKNKCDIYDRNSTRRKAVKRKDNTKESQQSINDSNNDFKLDNATEKTELHDTSYHKESNKPKSSVAILSKEEFHRLKYDKFNLDRIQSMLNHDINEPSQNSEVKKTNKEPSINPTDIIITDKAIDENSFPQSEKVSDLDLYKDKNEQQIMIACNNDNCSNSSNVKEVDELPKSTLSLDQTATKIKSNDTEDNLKNATSDKQSNGIEINQLYEYPLNSQKEPLEFTDTIKRISNQFPNSKGILDLKSELQNRGHQNYEKDHDENKESSNFDTENNRRGILIETQSSPQVHSSSPTHESDTLERPIDVMEKNTASKISEFTINDINHESQKEREHGGSIDKQKSTTKDSNESEQIISDNSLSTFKSNTNDIMIINKGIQGFQRQNYKSNEADNYNAPSYNQTKLMPEIMNEKILSETEDAAKKTPMDKKRYHHSNLDYKDPILKRQTSDEEKRKGRKKEIPNVISDQISRKQSHEKFEKEYGNMVEKNTDKYKRLAVIDENKSDKANCTKDDQVLSPENSKNRTADNRISNTTRKVSDVMSFWKNMEASPTDNGFERQVSSKISKPKNNLRRNGSTSSIKRTFLDDIHATEKEIKRIEIKRKSNVGEIMTPLYILPDNGTFPTRKSFIPKSNAMASSPLINQLKNIAEKNITLLGPQPETVKNQNKTIVTPDSNEIDRRTSTFGEVKENPKLDPVLVKQFEKIESRNTSSEPKFKPTHKKSISDTSIIVPELGQQISTLQRKNTIGSKIPKSDLTKITLPQQVKEPITFRKLLADGRERLQQRRRLIGNARRKVTLFGAPLHSLPSYPSAHVESELERGVPEFVVRCLKRIDEYKNFDGLYRINGDAEEVIKLKNDLNKGKYEWLDQCDEAALLTSTFKLFLREMTEPLVSQKARNELYEMLNHNQGDDRKSAAWIEKAKLSLHNNLDPIAYRILRYLVFHLQVIAAVTENRMDVHNLAIVFSPNIVYTTCRTSRPEQILMEMEWNNLVVEKLIKHANDLFTV